MKKFFKTLGKKFKALKKDKLNIFIIVLAVLVCIGGALLIIKNIKKAEPKKMTISVAEAEVNIGETVKIPVEITNNEGIYMARICIDYDADDLSFVSYASGDIFDLCFADNNPGKVTLILEMNEETVTKKDGVIATLEFKSKISSDPGEYSININKEETNLINTEFTDTDTEKDFLPFEQKSGKITIKEKEAK